MIEGKPYLGATGATGTMASSPLSVRCEQCGKTNERTLEEIASGPALVARFRALGGEAQSGKDVLAAAKSGNSTAGLVVSSAAETLGGQIGSLVNVLDPEAIVIGGGLGLSEGLFGDHLTHSVRQHIWAAHRRDLPILRAATGVDAGWMGAAACAWRRFAGKETPT
jgi:glucokinase